LKPIALQLYTVREEAARDLPGVLRRVAEIGYKGVELAGLHGRKPAEVAAMIRDLGLQISSSHTSLPTPENLQEILEAELALGNRRIICGFWKDEFASVDACKETADRFNQAAELVKPYGLSIGLHNHWWEFYKVNGRYPYEIVLEQSPGIFGQFDVYWAAYAGADPAEMVARFKSRLPLLHIKDGTLGKDAPHTAVGDGALDMPAIIRSADPNILEWLVVELDECATDMFEAVERSYDYLTSTGLAVGNK